jgi:hypothetical protein
MTIRKGSIVLTSIGKEGEDTNFRVEDTNGRMLSVRSLKSFHIYRVHEDSAELLYQTDTFAPGDTVRVSSIYVDQYNETDGGNDLTVVTQFTGNVLTSRVKNNCGEEFTILNERLHLVRPGKGFKKGDRVVIDKDLAKQYSNDGLVRYWNDGDVLTLTEDSGSRYVQTTSHVRTNDDKDSGNNIPTRWLKLYEEPVKRVVGETIKAEDIKVGDKVKASYTAKGMLYEITGVVEKTYSGFGDESPTVVAVGGGVFPYEGRGSVYTLLEEAPEPVNENLQRLLDAEVGVIAHGTYADEYWKKMGDDEWSLLELDSNFIRTTDHVFDALCKIKYGTLEIYKKVEDAD